MRPSDELERSRVGRRLENSPLVWLLVFEAAFIAIAISIAFWLAPGLIVAPFLILLVGAYFIYAWIAMYAVVEFQLWRRMRNLGHLLQFLGSLLVLTPVVWNLLPFFLGVRLLSLGFPGIVFNSITQVSFPVGLVMAGYGYYHREYHASDVDLYRNVVVRSGERIGVLTDGYSTRIYETQYDSLPGDRLRAVAEEYAVRFQKAGFYLWHQTDDTSITLYPVTYTGVGGLRLGTALAHLYRLSRKPDRLTWVRIEWSGSVHVHISPDDYRRIRRPVAHHILCAAVADAAVGSLLAYVNGDERIAVETLLGPGRTHHPKDLQLPTPKQDRDARAAIIVTAILLLAGSGAVTASAILAANPVSISNVRWSPQDPGPGDTIEILATVVNYGGAGVSMERLGVHFWAYFNDTTNGTIRLGNVQGNEYRATLGPFSDGTEVTFVVALEMQETLSAWLVQSPAYVLDIGTVPTGGSSGLTIEGITVPRASNLYARPSAWINSTAPIVEARLLVTGVFGYTIVNGGGGGGWGVMELPLTGTGSFYYAEPLLRFGVPAEIVHMRATLDLKFVARDATGNTVTSEFIVIEFNI